MKPAIIIGSPRSTSDRGNPCYSGGTKVYNGLVKLLRKHEHEAYTVTYDGEYPEWLIEHAPHCSLAQVREWKSEGRPLKYVTGWLASPAFLEVADEFYFLDCEMRWTVGPQYDLLRELLPRIRAGAVNSRTAQAWYMTIFGQTPTVLRDASDRDHWHPKPEVREERLVGFMRECPDTQRQIERIAAQCTRAGFGLRFLGISGPERQVRDYMRRCDYFLGMNPGKHPLWGEGCPRSPQEAMHAGAVVIAYNVHGNEEYLIENYSGYLVPRGDMDAMANRLVWLTQHPDEKERVRANSCALAEQAFSLESRWPALRNWLELD